MDERPADRLVPQPGPREAGRSPSRDAGAQSACDPARGAPGGRRLHRDRLGARRATDLPARDASARRRRHGLDDKHRGRGALLLLLRRSRVARVPGSPGAGRLRPRSPDHTREPHDTDPSRAPLPAARRPVRDRTPERGRALAARLRGRAPRRARVALVPPRCVQAPARICLGAPRRSWWARSTRGTRCPSAIATAACTSPRTRSILRASRAGEPQEPGGLCEPPS